MHLGLLTLLLDETNVGIIWRVHPSPATGAQHARMLECVRLQTLQNPRSCFCFSPDLRSSGQGEIFISFHPCILRCLQDALILAERHQISPCRSALHPQPAGYTSAALYLWSPPLPIFLFLAYSFILLAPAFPLCFFHFCLYVSASPCPYLSLHLSRFVSPCLSLCLSLILNLLLFS